MRQHPMETGSHAERDRYVQTDQQDQIEPADVACPQLPDGQGSGDEWNDDDGEQHYLMRTNGKCARHGQGGNANVHVQTTLCARSREDELERGRIETFVAD